MLIPLADIAGKQRHRCSGKPMANSPNSSTTVSKSCGQLILSGRASKYPALARLAGKQQAKTNATTAYNVVRWWRASYLI